MNERVYLDYAATTPLDERVLAVMMPYFSTLYGNPSSVHIWGQVAEAAMEEARTSIAERINSSPDEIIFTGCGTESDNLALRGTAHAMRKQRGSSHILISPVEHHAVLHTAHQLQEEGFKLEFIPVDAFGRVNPQEVVSRIRENTALVSVIYANNEIGTINPVNAIGRVCRERGVPFHTDAVQAAAHLKMDVEADCIDLLSIGAHKFYGPKGVGALYVRKGTPLMAVQTGGGQENGRRAGTQNIAYIVGMAEAFRLAQEGIAERSQRYLTLRDDLIVAILKTVPKSRLTGHPLERLPNHASFVFQGVDGNRLLMQLDIAGFGCSSGSACKTGNPKPSEVLTAVGLSDDWALGSLRVTLGRDTQSQALQDFLALLPEVVEAQRRLSV